MRILTLALTLAVLVAPPAQAACPGDARPLGVEFVGMPAPATPVEKADVYTAASVRLHCPDGVTAVLPLRYHRIATTGERLGDGLVGGLVNAAGAPLLDLDGPLASDGPDGTSLIAVDGLDVPGATGRPLALVTQFEYRAQPPRLAAGADLSASGLPATVGLTLLDQDPGNGRLMARAYRTIDFSGVGGIWTPCGATRSSWNTHVGSEEYEPDAKVRGGGARAPDSEDRLDLAGFSRAYLGDPAAANPYRYGLLPEIGVGADGGTRVLKHHAAGRYAREMQILASDDRTAIGGDDGRNTGLFMFVADRPRDLSAGTLYGARLTPIGAPDADRWQLDWVRLGHATDGEIGALVERGVRFRDLFDVALTPPAEPGYTRVVTRTGTEWLRLRPATDFDTAQAAAFLETRRYAALRGATTEFSKMEYVAFNPTERRFYLTSSRIEAGMADGTGAIRLPANPGGLVLEMVTAPGQRDTEGAPIPSDLVGTELRPIPELRGGWQAQADSEGNHCRPDRPCGPDNLVYADGIRTLFIGEDTDQRHNNYLWAFNLETRRLERILSVPIGAEVTGLGVANDFGGFAYLTANVQHPGAGGLRTYPGADKAEVQTLMDRLWDQGRKTAIGYLGTDQGALPAWR